MAWISFTKRQRKRLFVTVLIAGALAIASALVLYALRQNINLFYSPTQVAEKQAPLNHTIRVGGLVKKGSVKKSQRGLQVQFILTDYHHTLVVHYQGLLPDLFREGQGIVAEGTLTSPEHFVADTVLAKHDATYTPPPVKEILNDR
ncbi:MAG: cytochrome c-type biogenesis protein CcmE [marine bacterium B5-7]|nr:MAG: cytochrome c-type biogenesis protein CcmE [marine bacterium B5-7]